ncbi:hypothetical protein BKA63DRAFT_157612 [Paraphoma chrysanthemicola]|nr:hypothetical protein BKA63DRAFT_157612 [Paraphoma chrysanthemicola]
MHPCRGYASRTLAWRATSLAYLRWDGKVERWWRKPQRKRTCNCAASSEPYEDDRTPNLPVRIAVPCGCLTSQYVVRRPHSTLSADIRCSLHSESQGRVFCLTEHAGRRPEGATIFSCAHADNPVRKSMTLHVQKRGCECIRCSSRSILPALMNSFGLELVVSYRNTFENPKSVRTNRANLHNCACSSQIRHNVTTQDSKNHDATHM